MGERYTPYSDVSGSEAVVEDDETVDGVGTREMTWDGVTYYFESLDSEHSGMRAALEAYLGEGFAKARKAPAGAGDKATSGRSRRSSATGGGDSRTGQSGLTRAQGRECRQWGREQGFEVSDRGSMPKDVLAAWEAEGRPNAQNSPNAQVSAPSDGDPNGDDAEQGEPGEHAGADDANRELAPA